MAQDLQNKLDALIALIDDADRKIQSGIIINLNTLERDVESLCKVILNETSAQAKTLQPSMATLINKLDMLAQNLEAFKAEKSEGIDG